MIDVPTESPSKKHRAEHKGVRLSCGTQKKNHSLMYARGSFSRVGI